MSVCLCVCVSVCLSLRKSAVTFEPLDGSAQNFQGLLISSQLIFGRVTRTPGPAGSGPDPEKAHFRQIYLLRGFWGRGVVSHLFGIRTTRQTKRWERNFDFWPTAGENGAGRRGWPGADKNFGISTFFIKRTPAKIGRRSFSALCKFLIRRTPRAPRVPRGPGGVKIKSQNWVVFYRRDPPQNQILRTFCFIQLFDSTHP